MRSTERRDRTERARAVAAFGDLHVCPRRRRRGPRQLQEIAHAGRLALQDDIGDRALTGEADDGVGFWQCRRQLVAVALGHAAGDDQLRIGALRVGEGERDVDRLLTRGFDERARVDDDEIRILGRHGRRETVGEQGRDDLVAIDGVLRDSRESPRRSAVARLAILLSPFPYTSMPRDECGATGGERSVESTQEL